MIAETGRLTDKCIELDEGGKALLDEKLQVLREYLDQNPRAAFTVFCPDRRKAGGGYETVTGHVKKIDPVSRCVVLREGRVIPIDRIYGIDYDL